MSLPFRSGVMWFIQGWHIFKRQPIELMMIFAYYSTAMFVLAFIPLLGQLLNIVVLPLFTVIYMQACRDVLAGEKIRAWDMFQIKRIPAWRSLLRLGFWYALGLALATLPGMYFYGDMFAQALLTITQSPTGTVDRHTLEPLMGALVVMMLCLVPVFMAFWFAPNLMAWQRMPVFKSLFFSLMVWCRNWRAWIGYMLVFMLLSVILPTLFFVLIGSFAPRLASLVVVPYLLWVSVLLYCSFYPCYQSFFEGQEELLGPDGLV